MEGRGRRAERDRSVPGVAAARSDPAPPLPTHSRFATAARPSSTLGSQHARPQITKSADQERELPLISLSLLGWSPLADRDESAAKPGSRKRRGSGRPHPRLRWTGRVPSARSPACGLVCVPPRGSEFGSSGSDSEGPAFRLPKCPSFPEWSPSLPEPGAPVLSQVPRVRASTIPAERRPGARPCPPPIPEARTCSPQATSPAGKRTASTGMVSGIHE